MEKTKEYYESLDKRTKEYKEWKASTSSGLGDTIDKITEATGIKKAVKWIFGDDCGCDQRREYLNKKFPYVKRLTEEEFDYLTSYFNNVSNKVTVEQQTKVINIYNRIYNQKVKLSNCSSCYKNNIHNKLKFLYDAYKVDESKQ